MYEVRTPSPIAIEPLLCVKHQCTHRRSVWTDLYSETHGNDCSPAFDPVVACIAKYTNVRGCKNKISFHLSWKGHFSHVRQMLRLTGPLLFSQFVHHLVYPSPHLPLHATFCVFLSRIVEVLKLYVIILICYTNYFYSLNILGYIETSDTFVLCRFLRTIEVIRIISLFTFLSWPFPFSALSSAKQEQKNFILSLNTNKKPRNLGIFYSIYFNEYIWDETIDKLFNWNR